MALELPRSDMADHDDVASAPGRASARAAVARKAPVVIALFGPTASGKSAVAEAVADLIGTEVVSADAMQVYRGLPILTNQPSRPTRLVAVRGLDEEMSVGAYTPLVHAAIDELVEANGVAVVAGGTGLYLRAALTDLGVPPASPPDLRERIEEEYDADADATHARLADLDPRAATSVHVNDRRRVVRALELAEAGRSLVPSDDRLWGTDTRRPTALFGLDVPMQELERRIRERTAEMFRRGVAEEVAAAIAGTVSRTAAKTLGLHEIASLPPAEAEERIVLRTRRYAAYQRKWMRRLPALTPLDGTLPPGTLAEQVVRAVGDAGAS